MKTPSKNIGLFKYCNLSWIQHTDRNTVLLKTLKKNKGKGSGWFDEDWLSQMIPEDYVSVRLDHTTT
jgi:hypothetical protein